LLSIFVRDDMNFPKLDDRQKLRTGTRSPARRTQSRNFKPEFFRARARQTDEPSAHQSRGRRAKQPAGPGQPHKEIPLTFFLSLDSRIAPPVLPLHTTDAGVPHPGHAPWQARSGRRLLLGAPSSAPLLPALALCLLSPEFDQVGSGPRSR
jgi:hypothetical protein